MTTLSARNEYWVCLRIMQFVWMLCGTDSTTECAYIPTHHHHPTATGSHTEIHQGFAVSLQYNWMVWFELNLMEVMEVKEYVQKMFLFLDWSCKVFVYRKHVNH